MTTERGQSDRKQVTSFKETFSLGHGWACGFSSPRAPQVMKSLCKHVPSCGKMPPVRLLAAPEVQVQVWGCAEPRVQGTSLQSPLLGHAG